MRTIKDAITEAAQGMVREQFFGSWAIAKREAHKYVFEEWPAELDKRPGVDKYTFRQQFRLRLKTDDELAADQARTSTEGTE